METKKEQIENIHLSIVNGQYRQTITQMQEYLQIDLFADYAEYLQSLYVSDQACFMYLRKAINIYMRSKYK